MQGGLHPPGVKHEAQHLSLAFCEDFQYGFSTCEDRMMASMISRARAAAAGTEPAAAPVSGPGPGSMEPDSVGSAVRLYLKPKRGHNHHRRRADEQNDDKARAEKSVMVHKAHCA